MHRVITNYFLEDFKVSLTPNTRELLYSFMFLLATRIKQTMLKLRSMKISSVKLWYYCSVLRSGSMLDLNEVL